MTLIELKDLLDANRGKQLIIEYTAGAYTDPDFHITEIKKCAIEAVNCGGGVEYWNESIIQLWENPYATTNDRALILSLGEVKADCKDKEACGIVVPAAEAQSTTKCAPKSGCC